MLFIDDHVDIVTQKVVNTVESLNNDIFNDLVINSLSGEKKTVLPGDKKESYSWLFILFIFFILIKQIKRW